MLKISMDREYFYELVDKIPVAKLGELRKALLMMGMPEVEATEDELEAIKRGLQKIKNGEYHTYGSIDELRNDLLND